MSVKIEIDRSIAVLRLSESSTRNALSRALVLALHAALDDVEVRQARAVVIGSTEPFFCAGANIKDLLDGWMLDKDPATNPVRFFERIATDPRPTIAAVSGGALGGGFELMLSCDLAFADSNAWFCLPELGHGVIPNTALMRLQRIIGSRRMMQCMMTGQRIESQQALDWGLVNALVNDPLAESVEMAIAITQRVAPGALAIAKTYAARHAQEQWEMVHESLKEIPEQQWQEGLSAFTQKRPARYDSFWEVQNKNTPKNNS
jgi:enoyl-CoA hydratase/carnithine racemase